MKVRDLIKELQIYPDTFNVFIGIFNTETKAVDKYDLYRLILTDEFGDVIIYPKRIERNK